MFKSTLCYFKKNPNRTGLTGYDYTMCDSAGVASPNNNLIFMRAFIHCVICMCSRCVIPTSEDSVRCSTLVMDAYVRLEGFGC